MDKKVLFATKTAMIKLVSGSEFDVSRKTSLATKLSDDDEIVYIGVVDETQTMVMRTVKEVFLRISCDTIPEKKKAAVGVRGMRLDRKSTRLNSSHIL